ncbi:MAG: acetyl-CoA carboxylase biotin carboxyl carrier protein subunit [Clostridium sp.]|uniref:acetyl-CoA carboxylase biotin carboxyl carrier protein subunit n=1 Tax=Clostridium sp. TaxID=1506 RepID=UPI00290C6871|nr:acetyl-CoA carboxylase biotin carboxyl carrier protein subunit [Clostridium sp.]MDU7336807.1 acetyl-CoA carboxylase biotin carboxyl carrier protein subunit [Clostridium sp.]
MSAEATIMKADFPGKVLDIMVHEGDSITAGQPVILLEVMKMENELLAPASGVVEKISVEKNNSVGAGDPLLTIR